LEHVRKLDSYLGGSFFVALLASVVICTFVISLGALFEIVELIARGVAWRPVVLILLWGFPSALTFSIPVGALTSCLLVFGRLAADGEITAMKASGISMWRIMLAPLRLGLLLAVLCLYINNELWPRSHHACRGLIASLGVMSPVEMLDEGRFIDDFPGLTVYIGRKKDDRIHNVRIYDVRDPALKREIYAKSGVIRTGRRGRDLVIDLYDARVDPFSAETPGAGYFSSSTVTVRNALYHRGYRKREKDMTMTELIEGMRHPSNLFPALGRKDLERQRMSFAVELNKRLCLSISCLAFIFLGIPLGAAAHRKESSAGVGISIFLVLNFYLFIIIAESLAKHPEVRPDLITWLPVVISLGLGSYLVRRVN